MTLFGCIKCEKNRWIGVFLLGCYQVVTLEVSE